MSHSDFVEKICEFFQPHLWADIDVGDQACW